MTWNATRLVLQAIQESGKLTDKVRKDRKSIREALGNIKSFAGITGKMKPDDQGDPIKCAGYYC